MLYLRIDFVKLGARLTRMLQRPLSNGDLMEWLREKGFQIGRGGWLASPERLGALELREIIFSHPIDHLPGIA
jgi:hypothetical protein